MTTSSRITTNIFAALALGFGAASALAHPGEGMGMGHGAMHMEQGGMRHDAGADASHGMRHGGMAQGGMGPQGAMPQLMTPEERTVLRDKMRNAATPEERQKLAQANRAEMHKRAKEKGLTLPEQHGPRMGWGMGPTGRSAPADDQAH